MVKTTVIVNPTAGRGAGARLSSQLSQWLANDGLEFDLVTTRAPGHATLLAHDAVAQRRETVVAVGGDGTVNEVLNGLMEADGCPAQTALAVLPIGTGNDFAFGAGLPLDLRQACRVVARGHSRNVDAGWVCANNETPRYFGNGVGLGFDAIVNIESRKLKRLRGFLVYLLAVLKTLVTYYQAPATTIRIDGREIIQPSLMISIMNGQRFGGGFVMTPGSRMDDGVFDLCVTAKMARLRMLGFVPRFMQGTHVGDASITLEQGQSVTVVSDAPWASHVDGEIYGVGASRYQVTLLPQRLRLIC